MAEEPKDGWPGNKPGQTTNGGTISPLDAKSAAQGAFTDGKKSLAVVGEAAALGATNMANMGSASSPQIAGAADGQKSQDDAASQRAKLMALMGGASAAGTSAAPSQQNSGLLGNLLGGVGVNSAGGSAFPLGAGAPGVDGSMVAAQSGMIQGMPATEFGMPGRPGYQMVPLSSIQHPLPQQPAEKHVLSQSAEVLKEEMIGYVNAIIERMDRADVLKKVETFQIETASRKTFRQLTEHYAKLDSENKERATKIGTTADMAKKRTETQEQMIKKLQQQVLEITNLNKKIQTLEQKFESINTNNNKKFEAAQEKVNQTKVYLEQKIDATMALEEKFNQNKEDLKQVQDVMLRTKTEMGQQVAEARSEMQRQQLRHESLEVRMDKTIQDCKFWLDKYTQAYKDNDAKIGELQGEFNGRIETVFFQLSRRVTIEDMRKNFNKLNDMLFIKFQQVEDNKQALRDMINYQKFFYPLQMQGLIGENMQNLDAAMRDQSYVQYSQKVYDKLLEELHQSERESRNEPDREMKRHIDALDKAELKTTGWTTEPLDNVDHDFVTPLLDRYLQDLNQRIEKHKRTDEGFAANLRKTVQVMDARDLVEANYQKIATLKEEADRKEHELELERIRAEHNRKVKKIINEKVDFPKARAFKRQNSYEPQLEEFGDIDDADALKRNVAKTRRSINPNKKRELILARVADVAQHRFVKDILAQSITDSLGASAQGHGGHAPGPGINQDRRRRTGSSFQQRGTRERFGSDRMGDGQVMQGPDGGQMVRMPGGQLSPLNATGSSMGKVAKGGKGGKGAQSPVQQQQMQMMPPAPVTLEGSDRRKLIKEIREELKPLCSQIADFQIEKATQVIKVQIRKIENDVAMEDQKLHDKIAREIKSTQEKATHDLKQVERDIKENIRSFQRQRARDKSDYDIALRAQVDDIKRHDARLEEFSVNFEAIAIVNSMLIENVNMQLESEVADLLDRRMMSLFGVSQKPANKLDVQNTSRRLQAAQHITQGGVKSPDRSTDAILAHSIEPKSTTVEDKGRASVTIGLSPSGGTFSSIDAKAANGFMDESSMLNERATLSAEYKNARDALKATGQLPISIDNKCLMSMQDGRDTSIVLRLFKTACLSYAPTDVNYRDHRMSRAQLLQMRKDLIEKVCDYMQQAGLHKEGAIYPRRYFDDLVMEQHLAAQQAGLETSTFTPTLGAHGKLKELLSPRLPFGLPSGKQTISASGAYQQKAMNSYSMIGVNQKLSSASISQDETQMTSQMMPHVKGMQRLAQKHSPSDRNFLIPGSLLLDTDSEVQHSKFSIREKLLNNSTTRNIRNKTIDVPDFHSQRKFANVRSNLSQINSATRRHGQKKGSLPNHNTVLQSPQQIGSKPTLLVENSEAQLAGVDHHNFTLPNI